MFSPNLIARYLLIQYFSLTFLVNGLFAGRTRSKGIIRRYATYSFGDIATSSNDSDLRDGGVLDVDVDQGEVFAGVAVHQVDQLGVAAKGRK